MQNLRKGWIWRVLAIAWLGFAASFIGGPAAIAVQPEEVLKDSKLEARAREISAELRCLVCQNQSIDEFERTACTRPSSSCPRAAQSWR